MIRHGFLFLALTLGVLAPVVAAESFNDPQGDATPSSTDITTVTASILSDRMHLNLTLAGPVDSTGVYTHCDLKINPGRPDEAHYGVALVFGVFGGNRYVDGQPRNINTSASSWSGNTIRFVAERNETFPKDTLSLDCRTEKSSVLDIATKTFPEPASTAGPSDAASDEPASETSPEQAPASNDTLRTVDIGAATPTTGFAGALGACAAITFLRRKQP